jgi:hypothetical protein
MKNSSFCTLRGVLAFGVAAAVATLAIGESRAEGLNPVLPPLSYVKAKSLKSNPQAWSQFLAQLPHRSGPAPSATAPRDVPDYGGTWQALPQNTGVSSGLSNPLLLTDGTVIFNDSGTANWWKLTPDITGSYVNGTWTQIASLPVIDSTQYAPLYFASAVLPDGRVIIEGGEYQDFNPTWTNDGAIYDPVANAWTAVNPPSGWGYDSDGDGVIGDSESTVLADGTYMLAGCCNYPDQEALLDASSLTWTFTGAPNAGGSYQDEQGYNLLPNGNVLTIDIWTDYPGSASPTNAEQYVPSSGVWTSAGNTPTSLVDPAACATYEIGPAVMRPAGTLVAFGGNTGCTSPFRDPTAIYDTSAGTWSAGPFVPTVCGTKKTKPCDLADAPGSMLPNGNVLFAASSGYGDVPTHFFEYTAGNVIHQVADPLYNAHDSGAYYYNLLMLPNGQILMTDFSDQAEVYNQTGTHEASWAPVISSTGHPTSVVLGDTYTLSGTQLNGLTQGAYYGDDVQAATNFPIVQITNKATGHVFYARTTNPSTRSIEPGASSSVSFTVSAATETGGSTLVVIADGIASKPVAVNVKK